jgi:hypothetical protein
MSMLYHHFKSCLQGSKGSWTLTNGKEEVEEHLKDIHIMTQEGMRVWESIRS